MIKIENRCCDCASGAYPCLGSSCSMRHVEVHYCDRCGDEIGFDEEHESYTGEELCKWCFEEEQEELEDMVDDLDSILEGLL